MKWYLLIGLILLIILCGWLPFEGMDVATLEPVQVLYVALDGEVRVETEGQYYGSGTTVAEAVEDLKTTAAGHVLLRTIDYLILEKDSLELLPALYPYLRLGCMICVAEEKPDLETVGEYLRCHDPNVTVLDVRAGGSKIPRLLAEEGRTYLVK